jgi:adenosine deaminase
LAETVEWLERLPKAELHVHLDGCLRPETMLDLAREEGVRLPADDVDGLAREMFVGNASSLEEYLEKYVHTIAVMQSADALERVAYEFVIDAAAQNIKYVEVRYCPGLHLANGLSLAQAFEAPIAGIKRAEADTGTKTRIIISALRTLSPRLSFDLAKAAVEYRYDGVVAFDLAGAEKGHPARDHAAAFEHALGHGLHTTCHAGEGAGPLSVRQALDDCSAARIGHGVRILEDPELEQIVRDRRVPLEVCLTSNLHTHTVPDLSEHPLRHYFDVGCVVTVNTDSRLMDQTNLTKEFRVAHEKLGFTLDEMKTLTLNAVESAFLPDDERSALAASFRREMEEMND